MNAFSDASDQTDGDSVLWRPIDRVERRVLGVLVEKAKTTPESYPLSLAAIVTGANQKSNRDPQMQLDEDDVLVAIDRLRSLGAVREIQGSGRVAKYRHAAYEWLDVDAAGAALMTELLLRGPQTCGELRARTARMHDFPSLDDIQQSLNQLQDQGLVQPVTPPGRGQQFAHALYPPDEQHYLLAKFAGSQPPAAAGADARPPATPPATTPAASRPSPPASPPTNPTATADQLAWEQRLEKLEAEVQQLRQRLDQWEAN